MGGIRAVAGPSEPETLTTKTAAHVVEGDAARDRIAEASRQPLADHIGEQGDARARGAGGQHPGSL